MRQAFLGVESSILGRAWRNRLGGSAEMRASAIVQSHPVPDVLARIMAGRGQTAASAAAFLAPSLRDAMPDPSSLTDLDAAVERLGHAVRRGEPVAIFGDYDVDGACSAALLAGYLRAAGLNPVIHIPDRIIEGYGPNVPAIQTLARAGARLLVTVDCGTTSAGPLGLARDLGLDCVVIDHHQASLDLPPAVAVVNPNRQDDMSGLGALCATGVVFMVLVGLHRNLRQRGFWTGRDMPDLLASLDLVSLATVADVVSLVGLNRALVSKGLEVMRLRRRPGLAALFDVAGAGGPPTSFHLGFLIGPRLNAGGRIGDAGLGARLLLCDDPLEARRMAETLDGLNRERRVIESVAASDAEAMAMASLAADPPGATHALVTGAEGWHPGVVGLVAARLRERYERPAFAIAFDGPLGTGSGRSIPGVDLGRAVRAAVEAGLLVKGGGHAMAAGITIEQVNIEAFRAFLQAEMGEAVARARGEAALLIDAALSSAGATPDLVEAIGRAGPFGAGNPEPVFGFPNHRVLRAAPVGSDHLRLTVASQDGTRLSAVAFRAGSSALGVRLRSAKGEMLHLAGHLSINRWGGAGRAELRLLDAAIPTPH